MARECGITWLQEQRMRLDLKKKHRKLNSGFIALSIGFMLDKKAPGDVAATQCRG